MPDIYRDARSILERILQLKEDKIEATSSLQEDLGIDSVDFWDIISTFERKFKIKIHRDDLLKLQTVQDIYDLLGEKLRYKYKPTGE